MELINDTSFPGLILVLPDKNGYETLVVVQKGTFSIRRDTCVPADEQSEIVQADEFYGEADSSSIRRESDLAIWKPATDIVLLGHAYAPTARAKESKVALKVGPVGLTARIRGDRRWSVALGMVRIKGPEPFEKIPLVYERAFGGVQPAKKGEGAVGAEERNPVGTGFVKKRRKSFVDGLALPNIEDPKRPLKKPGQKPPPIGFGFVSRHWLPRRLLHGTYDKAWEENRLPLLPEDFDEAAFCGAPAVLQARPHFRGGEPVVAEGVSPRGLLRFSLPSIQPEWETHLAGSWTPLPALLDTVVLEPDHDRVCLTWRARLNIHNRVRSVRAVRMRKTA